MKRFNILSLLASLMVFCIFALPASATKINTADESSAYHKKFCPILKKALKKAQFKYDCQASKGTLSNIETIGKNANHIGYAQLDLFSLERTMNGGKKLFHTLRDDIAKVCLFMVSKNKKLKNYGHVAANADNLQFILPPEKSNHSSTFLFLQEIDPKGLGKIKDVSYASDVRAAVSAVLNSPDDNKVTMFVQFPDAGHKLFKYINENHAHFIPVIDRNILRQDVNGQKVYFAEDTLISNPKWLKKSTSVVTSCTPIVLFTGATRQITDKVEKQDHIDLIRTIEGLPLTSLRPQKNLFSQLWMKTKSLSAKSVESLVKASDQARKAAQPVVHQVKEVGSQAYDASKPYLNKAKEVGAKTLEKAGELAGQAAEKAKKMIQEEQAAKPEEENQE